MSYQPPPGPPPGYSAPSRNIPNQSSGYPPQGAGGYPPQGAGGYPPQGAGGYPPQGAGGYPPQGAGGYPPQGAGGYPPQGASGYPPQGTGGYPPQGAGGYPPANSGGYPPASGGGYPPQGGGGGYPPASGGGYPPSSGGSGYAPAAAGAAVGAAIGALGPNRTSSVAAEATQHTQSAQGPAYAEDPLDLLKTFDTVIIVDDSGSMQLAPASGGPTRWQEARDALAGLTSLVASKDPDGIDVHFLNSPRSLVSCTDPGAVRALFDSVEPDGATPTGAKIEELMMEYLDAIEVAKQCRATGQPFPPGFVEPRKRNYLIVTDGAATDDVGEVLVTIARRLDQNHFPLSQLGFSFIQVGDDPQATRFLTELDEAISGNAHVRDIVDTTPYRGMALSYDAIVKAILGGINRRYDRRSN